MKPLTLYKTEGNRIIKRTDIYPDDKEAWLSEGWTLTNPEASMPTALNINIANQEALVKAGLTIAQAKEIIKNRPFESLEDALSKSKAVVILSELGINLVV